MNYEDLVSKAQGPKNTFVGKNGSVQLLNEEEFMHSKLYYILYTKNAAIHVGTTVDHWLFSALFQ